MNQATQQGWSYGGDPDEHGPCLPDAGSTVQDRLVVNHVEGKCQGPQCPISEIIRNTV